MITRTTPAALMRADAGALPLADASVDLIVTSPPYWALRSYTDGGEHYDGQIGAEPTPAAYVDSLIECTREWMRVLKPAGSLWVNLGDKYSTGNSGQSGMAELGKQYRGGGHTQAKAKTRSGRVGGMAPKSLIGLPWRYAIRCIDDLGLILRAEIIWSKPNGLPESVTDRVRRSHEQWFHLTKTPRYFSAVDSIREPQDPANVAHHARYRGRYGRADAAQPIGNGHDTNFAMNPLGKLPGSVWEIATQPLNVPAGLGINHHAAFPMEWPRQIIRGWSPEGVCAECGFLLGSTYDNGMLGVQRGIQRQRSERKAGEVLLENLRQQEHGTESQLDDLPASHHEGLCGDLEAGPPDGTEERLHDGAPLHDGGAPRQSTRPDGGCAPQERGEDGQPDRESGTARQGRARPVAQAEAATVPVSTLRRPRAGNGNADACPHCGSGDIRPGVIADPFGGTGTTALVAAVLGRFGISGDMSADYLKLARWRTTDPRERAAAREDPRPARDPAPDHPTLYLPEE